MGVEALVGGLFGLASAGVQAASASHVQSANAAAQANLNAKTMQFNREEALKARNFSSAEALKERNFNAEQAAIARSFNQEQILASRMFEERMANTAHQREVDDLRKAGLNPILSASGGNGAAVPVAPIISSPAASQSGSPAGHAASVSGLQAPRKENYMGAFASTALEAMRASSDFIKAKASKTNAETEKEKLELDVRKYEETEKAYVDQQIKTLKADENWKNWQSKTEEEKVKLVKEQLIATVEHVKNEKRATDAEVAKCGALAYAAVKNADTEAAYKAKLGEVQEANGFAERKKLINEAEAIRVKSEEGMEKTKRDFYNSFGGKFVYIVDQTIGAISPVKLNLGGK